MMNPALGLGFTTNAGTLFTLTQPLLLVTVRPIAYVPGPLNTCTGLVWVDVLAVPLEGSLKFHCQFVRLLLLATDLSVKAMVPVAQIGPAVE